LRQRIKERGDFFTTHAQLKKKKRNRLEYRKSKGDHPRPNPRVQDLYDTRAIPKGEAKGGDRSIERGPNKYEKKSVKTLRHTAPDDVWGTKTKKKREGRLGGHTEFGQVGKENAPK